MAQPSASPNRALFETPLEPPGAPEREQRQVLTPAMIMKALWRARALGLTIVGLFLALGLVYALFLHKPVYTSSAVIEPPISSGPQLSGASQMLASFAGIESGTGAAQFTKYMQVIDSIRFAERMEQEHHVMQILNKGWDPQTRTWHPPTGFVADLKARVKAALGMQPWTPPDATSLAKDLRKMTTIALVPGKSPLDLRSQVFSVTVEAKNPRLAYNLLDWTLRIADELVREDQLDRTTNRIAYLRAQIDSTQEVYLRGSLQQILMGQEQTLMTLHGDKYFAVDLIDLPNFTAVPAGMSATLILVLFVGVGLFVYGLIVLVLLVRRLGSPKQAESLRAPFPNPIGSVLVRAASAFR